MTKFVIRRIVWTIPVFLIVILFTFIALLEDCGYMARAASLMDKLMTKVGLSGKSFVPLMQLKQDLTF